MQRNVCNEQKCQGIWPEILGEFSPEEMNSVDNLRNWKSKMKNHGISHFMVKEPIKIRTDPDEAKKIYNMASDKQTVMQYVEDGIEWVVENDIYTIDLTAIISISQFKSELGFILGSSNDTIFPVVIHGCPSITESVLEIFGQFTKCPK